jgi:3-hydroxy acid dehydrogenase / malonic semialdehyde reductase
MLVFITGATSGIGRSIAWKFASQGHDLVLTGRRQERLDSLESEIATKHHVKVQTICFDVRSNAACEQAVRSLKGEIDILVNNAGLAAGLAPLHEGDVEHWDRMIDTNVKGLLYITRAVTPGMAKRGRGHVINIGSIAGKEVYANGNVYCGTKHAVDAISRAMRIDLVRFGIKVTAVNPGMVETEFSIVRFDGDEKRASSVYAGMKPLSPEDIAESVYWAATQPAHVNVSDIVITPAAQANATTVIRSQNGS